MYTIKQASIRTGVSIPLLRAWERRYGIPTPARTASGYRLYDDPALDRVRQMRDLVETGWAPRQAARAVLDGTAPPSTLPTGDAGRSGTILAAAGRDPTAGTEPRLDGDTPGGRPAAELMVDRFVAAAVALDEAALDRTLSEAFAALRTDDAISRFAMPALAAVGEAWADGRLDVAGEHAASNAVMRRLGAVYEAAGESAAQADAVVGLPPGGRHEAGALAFAVACRRAGLRVLYLGADVPADSWLAVARAQPRAAIVLATVTEHEAESARRVARALHAAGGARLIAAGGASAGRVGEDALPLPEDLREAVAALRARLSR